MLLVNEGFSFPGSKMEIWCTERRNISFINLYRSAWRPNLKHMLMYLIEHRKNLSTQLSVLMSVAI